MTVVRKGSCSGCGACCRFMFLPLDRRVLNSPHLRDWRKWLDLHGVILEVTTDTCRVRIPLPCLMLNDLTGACNIHGNPDRPEMCDEFPYNQVQLEKAGLTEKCSYTWEQEEE